ncbi:hypothetical protein SRHO_G00260030 [Serrasalmus rhombeus]
MSSTPVTETKIFESLNHTIIPTLSPTSCKDATCIFFAVANVIIFVTGVAGNGLVIWIAGFKMKKSVLSTWYLSLAVSDFLFCCTLPFGIVYAVKNEWLFGRFMCKFRYFIMFINMYSSIFLLAIISLDRCVVVMFPVWAQNKRTVRKASVMVILAWIMSATLSVPMAIFHNQQEKLVDNHMKSANSILNPILYTFMGKDFKKQCYAILSKIENALQEEEGHDTVQVITFTASEERRLPTTVQ